MSENTVLVCPLLLNAQLYNPDTLDLNDDEEARKYWFECFNELVKKFSKQAANSQCHDPTAEERAQLFEKDYIGLLNNMKDSNRNKPLAIRTMLELNESCLRLHGFTDPWLKEKKLENAASIKRLKSRLNELDELRDENEKWIEIFRGILAGNIFDWGAQAVSQILENDETFGLHDALKRIEPRPWLIDGLDDYISRIHKGLPYKCAVIFVDNSGVDIILGVLPFARELLIRGTKVLLCANNEPSLNDITVPELNDVIKKCSQECAIIAEAVDQEKLLVYGNGQNGPCLDMRKLSPELYNAIKKNDVDLLVIEGMGRALHTNLNAQFNCETLKLAVIKNKWLANRLGGDTFSIICKYETVNC